MKFGDLVAHKGDAGIYMYVAPYFPDKALLTGAGPYAWIADVKTEWLEQGRPPDVTWAGTDKLYPIDE